MRSADKIWSGYREQLKSCKEQHNKRMQSDRTNDSVDLNVLSEHYIL
jgi:hypothetical protein